MAKKGCTNLKSASLDRKAWTRNVNKPETGQTNKIMMVFLSKTTIGLFTNLVISKLTLKLTKTLTNLIDLLESTTLELLNIVYFLSSHNL